MGGIRRGIGLLLAAGTLLLAGCVSSGGFGEADRGGGYPGGYVRPDPGYPQAYRRGLEGMVEAIDRSRGRIVLRVDDPRSGRGGRTEVQFDRQTRLFHQGREAAVEGLEPGDVVRIDVDDSGRAVWARSIEVLRDVRQPGYGGGAPGAGLDEFRGPVLFVDTRSQLISVEGGGYSREVRLRYDGRTSVEYRGRRYRPQDLDRGDLVRIQARRVGHQEWLAERIIVERSVRH